MGKLTKKEQRKSILEYFCLNCRQFVILQNKKGRLCNFRAMVILIKKIFDLFVSDDADWDYHSVHC